MRHPKTMLVGLATALLCAGIAIAADSGKAALSVLNPVTINGTTLAPGDYQVRWEGSTGQVKVTVLQGKKVVATVAATIQPRGTAYGETVLVTTQKAGETDVVEIRPEGLKEGLVLETATSQQ